MADKQNERATITLQLRTNRLKTKYTITLPKSAIRTVRNDFGPSKGRNKQTIIMFTHRHLENRAVNAFTLNS